MQFKNLEDKCLYYRSLTDYKLMPNSYVMVCIDGRSFSHLIKNKFQKPFDDSFIEMMNETAKYVCENVQGCKFAYTQSDEVTFVLTDFDTPTTDAFFNYRLCKMQSIIASLATAKFNQLMLSYHLERYSYKHLLEDNDDTLYSLNDAIQFIDNAQLYQFDCRCWTVPTLNDAFAYLLWRQIDCVRNSKQQTAQTFLTHKELMNKNTDAQIQLLLETKNIDWNTFPDSYKYGRFIYKKNVLMSNIETNEVYHRYKWLIHTAFPLMDEYGREKFFELDVIPKRD